MPRIISSKQDDCQESLEIEKINDEELNSDDYD